MPQTINTNLISLNAQRNLNSTQSSLSISMQRLSSGLRVNSAKDDAAGLAIAERMNTQIRGMNVAMRNANDGISMAQVAEGALSKASEILQRMRELAVQSANGTNTDADRVSLNQEYQQMAVEIQRMLNGQRFNGKAILADTSPFTFQVGAGTDAVVDTISVAGFQWTTAALGITAAVSGAAATISNTAGATDMMARIDVALDSINSQRAIFGAVQNRFEAVVNTLQVAMENQSAARSRIMDADYAVETANLSRAQILQQAGNAMVAQANQLPQQVLSLLRGG
jgi:flagellin